MGVARSGGGFGGGDGGGGGFGGGGGGGGKYGGRDTTGSNAVPLNSLTWGVSQKRAQEDSTNESLWKGAEGGWGTSGSRSSGGWGNPSSSGGLRDNKWEDASGSNSGGWKKQDASNDAGAGASWGDRPSEADTTVGWGEVSAAAKTVDHSAWGDTPAAKPDEGWGVKPMEDVEMNVLDASKSTWGNSGRDDHSLRQNTSRPPDTSAGLAWRDNNPQPSSAAPPPRLAVPDTPLSSSMVVDVAMSELETGEIDEGRSPVRSASIRRDGSEVSSSIVQAPQPTSTRTIRGTRKACEDHLTWVTYARLS